MIWLFAVKRTNSRNWRVNAGWHCRSMPGGGARPPLPLCGPRPDFVTLKTGCSTRRSQSVRSTTLRVRPGFTPLPGQDQNGDWRVSAVVYYSNAIFVADFLVHLSGMIDMVDDVPIAADLDDKVEAPLSIAESLSS